MTTQFLNISAGKIAFDDTGSGSLVLCVPGMGDLRQEYRYLVPQLTAAGYRVVTMDIRGHGETSTGWQDYSIAGVGEDILTLVQHLNSGPAILVGSSMASGAAVWAAAEAPEWVRGLVLLGPAVRGEPGLTMRLMVKMLFARPWGPAAWIQYYPGLFKTRKPGDLVEYAARLKQNLTEKGRLEALGQMAQASQAASAVRLGRVKAPSLAVMGSRDPDFQDPPAEVAWIAGQLKGAYQVIDGAGHYPQTEFPELTGPLILDFLAGLQTEVAYAAPIRG
jgi:pimeloyl-ACP methyl ester carboxylesterase